MTMDPNSVRGLTNQLLSALNTVPVLDESTMQIFAGHIRAGRSFAGSPAEYAEAIAAVLREGHLSPGAIPLVRRSEAEVLQWLGRLAEELSNGPPDIQNPPPRPRPGITL